MNVFKLHLNIVGLKEGPTGIFYQGMLKMGEKGVASLNLKVKF